MILCLKIYSPLSLSIAPIILTIREIINPIAEIKIFKISKGFVCIIIMEKYMKITKLTICERICSWSLILILF